MFEKIRNLKNKKGFTLVELIVVLVILAILAALLVPALTGYIDKAKEQSLVSEASMVLTAAQATVSEAYGSGAIDNTAAFTASAKKGDMVDQIKELSETAQKTGAHWAITLKVADANATYKTIKIATLEYTDGKNAIKYTEGTGWGPTLKGHTTVTAGTLNDNDTNG